MIVTYPGQIVGTCRRRYRAQTNRNSSLRIALGIFYTTSAIESDMQSRSEYASTSPSAPTSCVRSLIAAWGVDADRAEMDSPWA